MERPTALQPRHDKKKTFILTLALSLCLSISVFAETLQKPEYILKISDKAKITERLDTGWETVMTVEEDGQRARVRWGQDGLSVIFMNATLRLLEKNSGAYKDYQLTIDFEGKRYRVVRTPREVSWTLPGQSIFFRLYSGKIAGAVGSTDFLKVTRNTSANRMQLESQAGSSDVILRKGKLEVFEGPEVSAHTYFLRGLSFKRGPITLEIPLPTDAFISALPSDRYLNILSTQTPSAPLEPVNSETAPGGDESIEKSPLQAKPPSWNSPVYRSNLGDPKEDPLNAKKEKRFDNKEDPLKAKTEPNSEDILKVKDLPNDSTYP